MEYCRNVFINRDVCKFSSQQLIAQRNSTLKFLSYMRNGVKTLGLFCDWTNNYDLGNKGLRTWQAEICLFSNSEERCHLNCQENVVNTSENLSFNTHQKTNSDQ